MSTCSQPQAEPENLPIFPFGESIWEKAFRASMETNSFVSSPAPKYAPTVPRREKSAGSTTLVPAKGICILSGKRKQNPKTTPGRIPELPAPPDPFHHHSRKSRPHPGYPRQTPNSDPGVVPGVRYL